MSVKPKNDLRIISHWGDCIVLTLSRGNSIEIVRSDGTSITRETNKRKDNGDKSEKFEQISLFDTHDNGVFPKHADLNLLMPADYWTKGESRSESGATMDKTEVRE